MLYAFWMHECTLSNDRECKCNSKAKRLLYFFVHSTGRSCTKISAYVKGLNAWAFFYNIKGEKGSLLCFKGMKIAGYF